MLAALRYRSLTSRMPQLGTSGSVGAVGGNSHRDPALSHSEWPLSHSFGPFPTPKEHAGSAFEP